MRCLREQGITTAEANKWLLLNLPARFHRSRVEPLSENAVKRCEGALRRLEEAVGTPLAPQRHVATGAALYHHAEQRRRAAKAQHDELLQRLEFDGAWSDRGYLRALIELGRRSIDAVRAQIACAAGSGYAGALQLEVEAWPASIARAEARLAELDQRDHAARKQRTLDELHDLTTVDIERMDERQLERILCDLDPGWHANGTPSTDAIGRRTVSYDDA